MTMANGQCSCVHCAMRRLLTPVVLYYMIREGMTVQSTHGIWSVAANNINEQSLKQRTIGAHIPYSVTQYCAVGCCLAKASELFRLHPWIPVNSIPTQGILYIKLRSRNPSIFDYLPGCLACYSSSEDRPPIEDWTTDEHCEKWSTICSRHYD